MDCIGNGDNIILVSSPKAQSLKEYNILENSFKGNHKYKVKMYSTKGSQCNSDQKSFPCGIAILAAKKKAVIGFYTSRIHTKWDTVASDENIEFISDNLYHFVQAIVNL